MHYTIDCSRRAEKLLNIRITCRGEAAPVRFSLPLWRPGRYERQAFDRLITDVEAFTERGEALPVQRLDTLHWQADAPEGAAFTLQYAFYANRPDAGGSYLADDFVYINPANCLMYREGQETLPCSLAIELPETYLFGCGLPLQQGLLHAADYHELIDSPILAGERLLHKNLRVEGIDIHFWIQGDMPQPALNKLLEEAPAYTQAQLQLFGTCPVDSFHYLILIRPNDIRHGVEHQRSTVLAFGPDSKLLYAAPYRSLLELCSHEFFHTWNVKALRPAELSPYDYSREAYTVLHHVTEGVTSYYGDLMIWKAGLWSLEEWLQALNAELLTYYQKPGRLFVTLEQSSLESWSTGYLTPSIPERKLSFYNKGYLVAFLLDVFIREATANARSLDDVMRVLYERFGQNGKGYTREDYLSLIAEISGRRVEDFAADYLAGLRDLGPAMHSAAVYMGLQCSREPLPSQAEAWLGISLNSAAGGYATVELVHPGSPAHKAGLRSGDLLIALNGRQIQQNIEELVVDEMMQQRSLRVNLFRDQRLRKVELELGEAFSGYLLQLAPLAAASAQQLQNRKAWQALPAGAVASGR